MRCIIDIVIRTKKTTVRHPRYRELQAGGESARQRFGHRTHCRQQLFLRKAQLLSFLCCTPHSAFPPQQPRDLHVVASVEQQETAPVHAMAPTPSDTTQQRDMMAPSGTPRPSGLTKGALEELSGFFLRNSCRRCGLPRTVLECPNSCAQRRGVALWPLLAIITREVKCGPVLIPTIARREKQDCS